MKRGCRDSGRKTRDPPFEYRAPRRFFERLIEESDPIADAFVIAKCVAPRAFGDSRSHRWMRFEAALVALDPSRDRIAPTHRAQRFGRHRAAIGKPTAKLRTGARENRIGLVDRRVVWNQGASMPKAIFRSSVPANGYTCTIHPKICG